MNMSLLQGDLPTVPGPLLWVMGSCCHAMRSLPSPLQRFGVCFSKFLPQLQDDKALAKAVL